MGPWTRPAAAHDGRGRAYGRLRGGGVRPWGHLGDGSPRQIGDTAGCSLSRLCFWSATPLPCPRFICKARPSYHPTRPWDALIARSSMALLSFAAQADLQNASLMIFANKQVNAAGPLQPHAAPCGRASSCSTHATPCSSMRPCVSTCGPYPWLHHPYPCQHRIGPPSHRPMIMYLQIHNPRHALTDMTSWDGQSRMPPAHE